MNTLALLVLAASVRADVPNLQGPAFSQLKQATESSAHFSAAADGDKPRKDGVVVVAEKPVEWIREIPARRECEYGRGPRPDRYGELGRPCAETRGRRERVTGVERTYRIENRSEYVSSRSRRGFEIGAAIGSLG